MASRRVRARPQGMPPPGAIRSGRFLSEGQVRDEYLVGQDSQPHSGEHQARVRLDRKATLTSHRLDAQVQRRPTSRKADIVQ